MCALQIFCSIIIIIINSVHFLKVNLIYVFALGTQMVMSDLTDDSQRAEALGRISLSYGVGMVLGPLVGGLVTRYYM